MVSDVQVEKIRDNDGSRGRVCLWDIFRSGTDLALKVQNVVKVLVDLLGLAVLLKQPAEHALAAHPDHLRGEARISGTLPLTGSHVATLPLGLVLALNTGPGVDVDRLADHVTILDLLV